jgi:GcrA cell cycle regulator
MNTPSQPSRTGWTDARLAHLVELWTARLSATQIARQLGDGLTRSAVVGKLFRMGLTRDSAERTAARADGARESRRKQRAAMARPFRPPPVPLPTPKSVCRVEPLMTDILDLQPSSCRWPYAVEDGTKFCGHPKRPGGGPYCPDHHRRAYDALLPPLTREQIENLARRAS